VREALTVWTALTLYHNAGHQQGVVICGYLRGFHQRSSAIKILGFVIAARTDVYGFARPASLPACPKDTRFFIADKHR
jgi:hypothetical protein